jgi:hypothetical protein
MVLEMALFRRPKDDGEDADWLPADDAVDFSLSERQRQIHKNRETYRLMAKLYAQIQERWRHPWRQA